MTSSAPTSGGSETDQARNVAEMGDEELLRALVGALREDQESVFDLGVSLIYGAEILRRMQAGDRCDACNTELPKVTRFCEACRNNSP